MWAMLGDNLDEEFVAEEEAENPALVVKRLREKLAKAEAERTEYLDGWQRSKADFANFKREEEERRGYTQERMAASLAEEVIPVLDSLEMAAKHQKSKELEIIQKQLLESLRKMGVESFGKKGEVFDPHKHEAVREAEVELAEDDHTIVSVERSGYTLSQFVIRPAQVSVGAFKK